MDKKKIFKKVVASQLAGFNLSEFSRKCGDLVLFYGH